MGDVTLTILHEACHAALGGYTNLEESSGQHQSIYNVEYSYMVALQKFGVEFTSGNFLEGEYDFVGHVIRLRDVYGSVPEKQVPISEIIRRWTWGVRVQ